jgi:methyl-accepting chemotaxis protein
MIKLTLRTKLYGGFFAVIALLIFICAATFAFLNHMVGAYHTLIDEKTAILMYAKDIEAQAIQQTSSMRDFLLFQHQESSDTFNGANQRVAQDLQQVFQLVQDDKVKQMLTDLDSLNSEYFEISKQILDKNNIHNTITIANYQAFPIADKIQTIASQLAQDQQKAMNGAAADNVKYVKQLKSLLIMVSIAAVILASLLGFLIARNISRPIVHLSSLSKKIADGDLREEQISIANRDETGELARTFRLMRDQLRLLIEQMRDSVVAVAASSEQLTASAKQTAQSAQSIAESIQEVTGASELQVNGSKESARAMEEMAAGVQRIAESSGVVSDIAVQTMEKVNAGFVSLQNTVNQMNGIQQMVMRAAEYMEQLGAQSDEIGKITDIIYDISAQTNLLALNASIEAARAGEHGRGFAVVANEVKKLAALTQESTKRVSDITSEMHKLTADSIKAIRQSVSEVQKGNQTLHLTSEMMSAVKSAMSEAVAQIQEVSAVSEEVSAGVEQVLSAVEEVSAAAQNISKQTQTVAAATEEQLASMDEITSSAASLKEIAQKLQDQIRHFIPVEHPRSRFLRQRRPIGASL